MAVIKVELSNNENIPVYFHTSADIVYFSSRFTEGLTGNNVQEALSNVNARVNDMITKIEDLENVVSDAKKSTTVVEQELAKSTYHFVQSAFIKTEYFEASANDQPPYTAVLQLPAVKSTDVVIINPVQHADVGRAQKQLEAYNCISNLIIGDGTITLKCYEMKPLTGIPVQIVVLREKGE